MYQLLPSNGNQNRKGGPQISKETKRLLEEIAERIGRLFECDTTP